MSALGDYCQVIHLACLITRVTIVIEFSFSFDLVSICELLYFQPGEQPSHYIPSTEIFAFNNLKNGFP